MDGLKNNTHSEFSKGSGSSNNLTIGSGSTYEGVEKASIPFSTSGTNYNNFAISSVKFHPYNGSTFIPNCYFEFSVSYSSLYTNTNIGLFHSTGDFVDAPYNGMIVSVYQSNSHIYLAKNGNNMWAQIFTSISVNTVYSIRIIFISETEVKVQYKEAEGK